MTRELADKECNSEFSFMAFFMVTSLLRKQITIQESPSKCIGAKGLATALATWRGANGGPIVAKMRNSHSRWNLLGIFAA
jgi:hypothetical protein